MVSSAFSTRPSTVDSGPSTKQPPGAMLGIGDPPDVAAGAPPLAAQRRGNGGEVGRVEADAEALPSSGNSVTARWTSAAMSSGWPSARAPRSARATAVDRATRFFSSASEPAWAALPGIAATAPSHRPDRRSRRWASATRPSARPVLVGRGRTPSASGSPLRAARGPGGRRATAGRSAVPAGAPAGCRPAPPPALRVPGTHGAGQPVIDRAPEPEPTRRGHHRLLPRSRSHRSPRGPAPP
jgi:hypothetical protein